MSGRGRAGDGDGFGQTMLEDLRFMWRFARCRRVAVRWRRPTGAEAAAQAADPVAGRFGDEAYAVAAVRGQAWIVRERDFSGWPGPPRYVFIAWARGRIWAARDFEGWPRAWRRPEG